MSEHGYPKAVFYMPAIVKALHTYGGSAKASVVKEWIAAEIEAKGGIVPTDILNSGALKFTNDLQWGRLYLVKGGWLEPKDTSGYGIWQLTGKSREARMEDDDAKALYDATTKKKVSPRVGDTPEPEQLALEGTFTWETELADILSKMEPGKFETLCFKLMMESGFEPHSLPSHINSPDGGVDGVGMLPFGDKSLIKIKVAWQCKRFKEKSVSAQVIRDFRGSLDGVTQYGIIFTSSIFSQTAITESKRPGATPIQLVDLEKLIELLEARQMGVTTKEVVSTVTEIDAAYFSNIGSFGPLL